MMRVIRILAGGVLAASLGACTYMEQRWNDYCDVGTFSGSVGAELSVKFGEFAHLGFGGTVSTPMSPIFPPIPFFYQLVYGNVVTVTELWSPVSVFFAYMYDTPMGLHTVSYQGLYPYPPVPGATIQDQNPQLLRYMHAPPEHSCWALAPFAFNHDPVPTMLKDYFNLEGGIALVLGVKVLLRPVEFADFMLGIIPGVDILGDDALWDRVPKGPYWYKVRPPEPFEPVKPDSGPDHIAEGRP